MHEMDFTTIRPMAGRILIQKIVEETSAGGIIISREHALDNSSFQAKVLAVGPAGYDEQGRPKPVDVAIGDVVVLPALGPQSKARMRPVPLSHIKDAENVFSVPSDMILAVLDPSDTPKE